MISHNPRWPKCDWCAQYPGCEEGRCECCIDKCNCQGCVGPVYENVWPREKYADAWKAKTERDRVAQ